MGIGAGLTLLGAGGPEFRLLKGDLDKKPGYLCGLRRSLLQRYEGLKLERESWWRHWREISTYLLPRNGYWLLEDRSRGEGKHNQIYDSTPTRALYTLASGLMSGATSPARPWFNLTTADPELARHYSVNVWLREVRDRILRRFQRSNTYRALAQMYLELGAFGTGCSILGTHHKNLIHHHAQTVGQYCIAQDFNGDVVTVFREFERTVGEVVREFGIDVVSERVRNLHKNNKLDDWVTVVHAIEPRYDRDASKLDDLNMAWRSIYFELNAEEAWDDVLRQSGFNEFPCLVPRWATPGGDIYGSSPGMDALGDIKGVQHKALRLAQGIDYQTKPPLAIQGELKDRNIDTHPGGETYVNSATPQGAIRPIYDAANLNLNFLLQSISDDRQRINEAFYADLFRLLANDDMGRMTATEVAVRQETKLVMLGPTLERLHSELLEPAVDRTFVYMMAAGELPPPPPELAGQELAIEFVSMLSQAQKAVGTNSTDRLLMMIGAVAPLKPEITDKLNVDELVDAYSDMLGSDPKLIIPTEQAVLVRTQRARMEAQLQNVATSREVAATAKDATAAAAQDPNATNRLVGLFSGIGA